MTTLSAAEMMALVELHMRLEVEGDLDGVMDTLTENVTWGTPTTVYHDGSEAVRAHYQASILPAGQFVAANYRGWADEQRQEAVGLWDMTRPGYDAVYPVVAVFNFRDGKITSERLFHDAASPTCSGAR